MQNFQNSRVRSSAIPLSKNNDKMAQNCPSSFQEPRKSPKAYKKALFNKNYWTWGKNRGSGIWAWSHPHTKAPSTSICTAVLPGLGKAWKAAVLLLQGTYLIWSKEWECIMPTGSVKKESKLYGKNQRKPLSWLHVVVTLANIIVPEK